ncbi:MAG: serine/threonine-protein kinase, partial [Polyangiaceae bacterium]
MTSDPRHPTEDTAADPNGERSPHATSAAANLAQATLPVDPETATTLVSSSAPDSDGESPVGRSGAPARRAAIPTIPAPPEPLPPEPGDVIGDKYELIELVASGGMGRVYRARHLQLRSELAIKIMHDFVAGNPEHVERFRREALAASKLSHPNVVRILDYGKLGGTLYLVMEYLDGPSLGEWLETQDAPPALSELLPILLQILDALIAAHDANVVHRDLKPDNVILTRDIHGAIVVKVVDFGLARFRDPEHHDLTITQADAVAGTPAYMSPEQCRSLKVTHSTDLYAFGCILTETLQLKPPFSGETVIDTISKHLFSPVPPLSRPESTEPVPSALERLRRDLLAKLPAQRPADARTTRTRLLAALADGGPGSESERKTASGTASRSERVPDWNTVDTQPPPNAAPLAASIGYSKTGATDTAVGEDCLLGLRSQGFTVQTVMTPDGWRDCQVVLLDGGSDVASTIERTRKARERIPGTRLIVCLLGLTTATIGQLIEAGADDVARGPVASDALGRKLSRLLRRRCCSDSSCLPMNL